ncbi:MAG TPA: dienelactone hydrolase family protein [Caulobacteraceae bacterium]|nr:dienelactone hydrolase family protein [Caulobacteraceae bacterium]
MTAIQPIGRFARAIALSIAILAAPAALAAEGPSIPLYAKGAHPSLPVPEAISGAVGDRSIHNVSEPTLTPYLPAPGKATGAGVIVAPGGAFDFLSWDNEGTRVAERLADAGVAAFVLKYRLNQTPADEEAFRAYVLKLIVGLAAQPPEQGFITRPISKGETMAAEDAAAAVRLVRARSKEWGIAPGRVGFLGFSAGAFTTTNVASDPDLKNRPDFIGVIYGGARKPADAASPPAFLAIAADDGLVSPAGNLEMFRSWTAAKRPVELHVYEKGGHGFGTVTKNLTTDLWFEEFIAWMRGRGLMIP